MWWPTSYLHRYGEVCRFIVLPASHWVRAAGVGAPSLPPNASSTARSNIDPWYESKRTSRILKLLAEGTGVSRSHRTLPRTNTCPRWWNTPGFGRSASPTMPSSRTRDMYWYPKALDPWKNAEFRTESGRIEFHVENPDRAVRRGQEFDEDREHLPRYFNPTEAYEGSPTWDKYKLILCPSARSFRVHSCGRTTPTCASLTRSPRSR